MLLYHEPACEWLFINTKWYFLLICVCVCINVVPSSGSRCSSRTSSIADTSTEYSISSSTPSDAPRGAPHRKLPAPIRPSAAGRTTPTIAASNRHTARSAENLGPMVTFPTTVNNNNTPGRSAAGATEVFKTPQRRPLPAGATKIPRTLPQPTGETHEKPVKHALSTGSLDSSASSVRTSKIPTLTPSTLPETAHKPAEDMDE